MIMLPYYSEGQQATWWFFLSILSIAIAAVFVSKPVYESITADNFILLRPKLIIIELLWISLFILTAPANYYGVQVITGEFTYQLWIYVAFILVSLFISPFFFSQWNRALSLTSFLEVSYRLWITLFVIIASLGLSIALTVVVWLQSLWALVYLFMAMFMTYLAFIVGNVIFKDWKRKGVMNQREEVSVAFLTDA
jgi:hypothetical protein